MLIIFPSNLLSIERWSAFKGKYPPGSDVDHRIIIVYKYGGTIKYFYVTSKVEKARMRAKYDMGSFVDKISSCDWEALTEESCVQCDKSHMYETCEDDLRRAYESGNLEILGKVPQDIRKRIISAVCASKSFTDAEKSIYTICSDFI